MNAVVNNKIKYNSFLAAFVIFLYGVCNIFSHHIQIAISLFAIGTIIPVVFNSKQVKHSHLIIFMVFMLLIMMANVIIHPSGSLGPISVFISFMTIGLWSLYIGILHIDYRWVLKYATILSFINIFANIVYVFLSYDNIDMLSMRFGYGILPSILLLLYSVQIEQSPMLKVLYILLIVITTALVIIYGSRGCLLVIMLYLAIKLYKKNKFLFCILSIGVLLSYNYVIDTTLSIFNIFPIESYKLNKLKMLLTSGVAEASSGRDFLYLFYWNKIKENLLLGCGLGYWEDINMLYPHNIFLQVGTEFGLFGLVLMVLYVCYSIYAVYAMKGLKYEFHLVVFAIMIGRLLVSSSYWVRPEFYFFLSSVLLRRKYDVVSEQQI